MPTPLWYAPTAFAKVVVGAWVLDRAVEVDVRPEATVVLRGRRAARTVSTAGRLQRALGAVGATPVTGHVEPEEDSVGLDALHGLNLRTFALGRHGLDDRSNLDLVFVICGSGELIDFGTARSVRRHDGRHGRRRANWGGLCETLPRTEVFLGGGQSRLRRLCHGKRCRRGWEEVQERMGEP